MLAETTDLAFLQSAKQFRLHPRAELGDLVEKESASRRFLEQALPIGGGAGVRAFHVSEELGFDDLVHECGAVDGAEFRSRRVLRE